MAIIEIRAKQAAKRVNIKKLKMMTIIAGEEIEGSLFLQSVDLLKYIIKKYYPKTMQSHKDLINFSKELHIKADTEYESNMFNNLENSCANLSFNKIIKGENIEDLLLAEIRKILEYWKERCDGKKIIFLVDNSNKCIPNELGVKIVEMIPLPKKDRTLIFTSKNKKSSKLQIELDCFIINHGV